MPNNKPPLPFNPAAAILLNQAVFTIKLDLTTGRLEMHNSRPDMNPVAVIGVLAAQIEAISAQVLQQSAQGLPGFSAPGSDGKTGEKPGDTGGGAA
jgi:hypothetical protein